MIGLDTNVLVRYLVQDDARQAAQSNRLIESFTAREPGFISIVTLAQAICVLQDLYARGRGDIASLVNAMLQTEGLVIQMSESDRQALRRFQSSNVDFADYVIGRMGAAEGCAATLTFDKLAARDAGMCLVPAVGS